MWILDALGLKTCHRTLDEWLRKRDMPRRYSAHMKRKREAAIKAAQGSPSAAPGQPTMPKGIQGDLYGQKYVPKDGEHYDGAHAAPKAEV